MITSMHLAADGGFRQNLNEEQLREIVKKGDGLLWVDFSKPTPDEVFQLDEIFGFHPLAIEDCQHTSKFPKLDEFANYIFIVWLVPNPKYSPQMETQEGEATEEPVQEIDIFVGPHYVVTYHNGPLPFLQALMDRARRDHKRVMGRGPAFFTHDILDAGVDSFFVMVEKFQDEAEESEERLQKNMDMELLQGVLDLKRRILSLRRQMNDHRELLQRLLRDNHSVIPQKSHAYFRNIVDHLNRIVGDLDVCRDTIDHAREVFLALLDARANQIMKVLTVLFTLSLPFTVLTGWYGMNFENLPLKDDAFGAFALTAVMVGISGCIIWWMRRKKWF